MSENPGQSVGTCENPEQDFTVEQAERLLRATCDFQAVSLVAREKCREDYIRAEREDDNTLRILVDGQIAALNTKLARPIAKVDWRQLEFPVNDN
jgi:hypothetical protein